MSFLQPLMLAALPLIALPIIIHLINQRRYQTIPWAAMMFLLAANRMSRGYARIRQWLILAMRVLAVAGLIFAVSRPLVSGWLALSGGAETTLILLDRSPSMRQQAAGTVAGKLETGREQLAKMLGLLGSSHWVLIESTSALPRELESPDALRHLPETEPVSSSADLPAMLESAFQYIQANKTGRTEIWICSDLRKHDWDADSGRWKSIRDRFLELPQRVRFHLLAYPDAAESNLAVRLTGVRRRETSDATELLVSFQVTQEGTSADTKTVPVQFEIDGARSELSLEMTGKTVDIQDHRIPLEKTQERGWGKISIPADANPGDNDFYFVFDRPAVRQTLIVTDNPSIQRTLELAAGIAPDPLQKDGTEHVSADQLSIVDWDKLALVLWHAPLPDAENAELLKSFVDRGGQVMFFPPQSPMAAKFLGVRWQGWTEHATPTSADSWRTDADVLANTQSGASLPVGKLEIFKTCGLEGEFTPLAVLKDGAPLVARVATPRGGVYFCATTPAFGDSSLASDGVVLYVMIQRALSAGATLLGNLRELVAGEIPREQTTDWQGIAVPEGVLSTDYAVEQGVYSEGAKLISVNRPAAEDVPATLDDARVRDLFQGLDFTRVNDQAGSMQALIEEIWRTFLLIMMIALLAEAALCLPRKAAAPLGSGPLARGFDTAAQHSETHPTGVAS